jgi:restriction endonuclease S subunit
LTSADYQVDGGVPVIRGSNLGGSSGEFLDDGFVFVSEAKAHALRRNTAGPGDLIFTQRGTLGQVAIIPSNSRFSRYVISQSQMRMTADTSRVDSRFLFFYFRTPKALSLISARALTTGVPHINLGILREFPLELPPLPEQRRIAEVLDRAEALRAKRRAALAQLDTLTQSIFLDMFGDPATNSKGWPQVTLGDVFEIARGGSPRPIDDYTTEDPHGINWVTIGDASAGSKYITATKRRIRLEGAKRSRAVKPGDFLLTNSMSFGRPYIMRTSGCIHDGWLVLAPRRDDVDAEFFYWLLSSRSVFAEFERRAAGATVKNLNIDLVRSVTIPMPAIAAQRNFSRRVAAIDSIKRAHGTALVALNAFFATLQHRAFRGEL